MGESTKKLQGAQSLLINRTISNLLPTEFTHELKSLEELTSSLKSKEETLLNHANQNFSTVKTFPEILDVDPREHIQRLQNHWS